ncbi:MAG: hypothetical protein RR933_08050 [Oscillospiraceae bacterium]
MSNSKRKINWKKVIGIFLFIALVMSIVFSVVKIIITPSVPDTASDGPLRSDYVLMLMQCCLGLVVMFLPSFVNKRFSIEIENHMYVMYFLFLYCAIYLGEVRQFYYLIPHWDSYLHAFSGAMLGALGFSLVSILNDNKSVAVKLSPKFIALFAFCFALSAGAIWEIYEFSGDALLGLNMQKFRLSDGTMLVGQAALMDTMKDLIIDAISALGVTIFGYIGLKSKNALLKKQAEHK